MKRIFTALLMMMIIATGVAFAQNVTATKYFVAHMGGYVGEATVTIDRNGKVIAATLADYQGPNGWAEYNSPDGKKMVDGAVVRVPDPMANLSSAIPGIKGYMFYILNQKDGLSVWSQYTPGKESFTRPTRQYERDFEGLMSNPIRAEAYVKAVKEDTLVNVTILGLRVTGGKKASETAHYGTINKTDPNSTYFPVSGTSIGFRYNVKAIVDFFMANPTANFAAATMKSAKVAIKEDKALDANASAATYTAATDQVWFVADAVTGATNSDFQHYILELQAAYKMALAEGRVQFKK